MNDAPPDDGLEALYEEAPCGFVVTGPDGTIRRANRTLLSWIGHERGDVVAARRFQDLLTVPGRIYYENQYFPLLRLQGSVKGVAFDLVCRGRAPLPVLVDAVQRTDAAGRPVLITSALFDATDRRAYERELLRARRSAEQLAAVVVASGDAILSTSAAGEIRTWNAGAERLFGYAARDVVGRNVADILSPGIDDAGWRRLLAELRAGRPVHLETVGRHAEGRLVDVSVGLTPHPDPLGHLAAASAIIRDIGERREIERLQQEFLAMVAHELRSPLAGIKGHAQLLRRRAAYSERAVDAIVAQADRLGRLIDDLLLAALVEADRLELAPEETDLVAEARAAAEALGIDERVVRLEADDGPIPVAADRQRLGQVLANLLANAIKYSPKGWEIVVRVGREAREARVAVVDRGVGIARGALPRLFDRFYRAPGAATRTAGLGLGLYISHQIVAAHGGRIEVESEPGRGSTFTVVLPLVRDAAG